MIRVLTEGRTTEVEYLGLWARELRDKVIVDFDRFHGTPLPLAQRAVDLLEDRMRAVRRGRDVDFDEVVCIFDRDEHPYVDEAVALAAVNGITVGYSNPCFELWLVLHRRDVRRHSHRHDVQRLAAELGLIAGKSIPPNAWAILRTEIETADARARRLDEMHELNGTVAGSNPSTSIPAALATIFGLGSEGHSTQ